MPARSAPRPPRRPVSIAEAARIYELDRRTVERWITAGHLPAWKFGPRMVRVDLDDMDALFEPVATVAQSR